ncbi:MAG TPA: glycogen debranching protein GlgX [Sphingomonas sp.]|jgi:glycogen operon protein|uniref:glycogen debranching protein GlgX n=1 Tax=Sphingomonas sp. TaxID=28214 RepID=UPI002EDA6BD0
MPERLESGSAYPLGATFDGLGVNFAVFSANADGIDLCMFDPSGRREVACMPLPECTDEVWHGYLPDARPGMLYGFRAHGRYAPEEGHRFNPNKLLLDPYAKQLSGQIRWTDALHGYRVGSPRGDLSFDRRDSAPAMPKCVVVANNFDWGEDRRPNIPWSETVIYEAHVKGLTQLMEAVRPRERGTYAALCNPKVIAYLQRLGITTLELLPIQGFVQDRFLQEKQLTNYWGYNSLSFFAPEMRYMGDGDANDLRFAIRRLHAAGIEVILDVVYNHTAEGSELGQTLSFRGLDNATYYRLQADNPRYCVNDTGTGNTLNVSRTRVMQMVVDSLRYWAESFHVDGFRFDLGVTLGRTGNGEFKPSAAFFQALRQDPVLGRLKLISEPWDIGPGGYQLGNHPPGFAEWNDKFRDSTRRFWRGDAGIRDEFAARLSGSGDIFDRRARRPWASVNYVASHDGQPLADVTAYEQRHNEANGEDNRDGHSENFACNWGAEGPTDDPAITATRERVRRSMMMTVLASLGTPMLLAGDEFGRTQRGNNNAYAQDNEISWLDWSQAASDAGRSLTAFVRRLILIRKHYPLVRSSHFLYGEEVAPGIRDMDWFDERGHALSPEDWQNPEGKALIMRRTRLLPDGSYEAILMLMNGSQYPLEFTLPEPDGSRRLLVDSADQGIGERDLTETTIMVQDRGAILIHATGTVA